MTTKATESRLQRMERLLNNLVSRAGIAGIDHQPASLPQVYRPTPGAAPAGAAAPSARQTTTPKSERLRAAFKAGRVAEQEQLQEFLSRPEAARDPSLAMDTYTALQGNAHKASRLLRLAQSNPGFTSMQNKRRAPTARGVMAAAEKARKLCGRA